MQEYPLAMNKSNFAIWSFTFITIKCQRHEVHTTAHRYEIYVVLECPLELTDDPQTEKRSLLCS